MTSANIDALVLEQNVFELFVRQAHSSPLTVAIVAPAESITYAGLLQRCQQIRQALLLRGAVSEQPIAVMMTRSIDLIATILAIWATGAAYLPLDPDYPVSRNRRMLADSQAKWLIADRSSLLAVTQAHDVEVIELAELLATSTDLAVVEVPPEPGGSRLAYILYTSGTTGMPKGVLIEHRSVVNLLLCAQELIGFGPNDRFLAAATVAFDISIAELFLPLISGGSVLLRDRQCWLDPKRLAWEIRQHSVTVVETGATTWSVQLAESGVFPRIRVVINTAEAISAGLARRLIAHGEQAWNLYGPTETTVWATAHLLTTDSSIVSMKPAESVSIGKPLPRLTAYVLDSDNEPVPIGQIGELCIGGVALARGYHRQEQLTDQRFTMLASLRERIYRTGDLVAWTSSGNLRFFGRIDDQVKIRGVRIEPAEVESALLTHAQVRHAAVTWAEYGDGARSLVAALVSDTEDPVAAAELFDWLESRLPPQMIPSHYVYCDALPLTATGKLDRNAIRALAYSQHRQAGAVSTQPLPLTTNANLPTSTTLQVLTRIWADVLQRPQTGPDEHFFTIGGDSLAAVRIVNRVAAALHVDVPVQVLFDVPTLKGMATRIDQMRARAQSPESDCFVFHLVDHSNETPIFFNEIDLRMAAPGAWQVPCSLYGVSHWAQGKGFVQSVSLPALARMQLAEIRRRQPSGPYRIAGYRFGALVAFEIAQALRQEGCEVEQLFLLFPTPPTPRRGGLMPRVGAATRLNHWFKRAANFQPMTQWLAYQLVHLYGRRPSSIALALLPKNRWPAFWYSGRRLAAGYVATPYAGRACAVVTGEQSKAEWAALLRPDAQLSVLDAMPEAIFAEPARTRWMSVLAQQLK